MTVHLSDHGEKLIQEAIARGLGQSPEAVVERALEFVIAPPPSVADAAEREQRRLAVANMRAFATKHGQPLGPGLTVQDLIRQCRKD